MMEAKLTVLDRWFEEQIALCGQRRQALLADDRADEATFEKIRANVYDIFRTVLSVAARTCGEKDAAGRFFRQRMESIPTSSGCAWSRSSWTRRRRSAGSLRKYGRERNDRDRGDPPFQVPFG